MRLDGRSGGWRERKLDEQRARVRDDGLSAQSDGLRQAGVRGRRRQLGSQRLHSGDGDFRVGAGAVRARPELILDERGHRGGEHLQAIDVGLRGAHQFVGCESCEKRVGGAHCNLELCQVEAGGGLVYEAVRDGRIRPAKPEVERLPGQQGAGGAAPDSVVRGRRDGSTNRRNDALRQEQARDVVAGREVLLP